VSDSTAPPAGDRPWHEPVTGRVTSFARTVDERLPTRLSSLLRRLADRDLLLQGSSLAFYGLVSALPTLMLTFAAAEALGGEGTLEDFASRAADDGPAGSAEFLEQMVANGGSLGFATVLFTLWPATVYGSGLRRALVDSTGERESMPGVRGRLLGLGTALVLPAMLLAGVPLMFVLSMLSGDGAWATALGWVLAVGAAIALGTGLISVVYRVFSPVTLQWPNALRGAAVTAALSAVFSLLFVVYLGIADVEERFGGGEIAIVVLLGVWLFVANVLLLAGYHAAVELEEGGAH
jgi:membrane protein